MVSLGNFFHLFITLSSALVLLHAREAPKVADPNKQPEFVRDNGDAYGHYGSQETDDDNPHDHSFDLNSKYEAYREQMEKQRSSSSKRQELSDTRFLANGKYHREGRMKLSMEILTGNMFYVEVSNDATVSDVKKKIESQEKYDPCTIILILKDNHGMNHKILEDDQKRLDEYGVKDGSHIYLFFNNLPLSRIQFYRRC